jgi:SOS-response transcriptional repressor LexA
MNVKHTRRENMRALSRSIGGISALAKRLNKSQSQISQLIGITPAKNIGDKIAAQVEKSFNKPLGWLDKDHYGVQESPAIYAVAPESQPQVHWIPIIAWEKIINWSTQALNDNGAAHQIPTHLNVGKRTFALHLNEEYHSSNPNIIFPASAIIITDPDQQPSHGSLVIVVFAGNNTPELRQTHFEGFKRILQPLNNNRSVMELGDNDHIIGVVRQVIIGLK